MKKKTFIAESVDMIFLNTSVSLRGGAEDERNSGNSGNGTRGENITKTIPAADEANIARRPVKGG